MNDEQGLYTWMRLLLFLPRPGSTVAREIDELHFFVVLTTLVASLVIGTASVYFVIRYRRRPGGDDRTPRVSPSFFAETAIIGIPLSFFLVWVVIGLFRFLHLATPPPGALTVYVTAKQWMWKFAYPEGPNGVEALRVPAQRPVRLLLTSRDVIHSFYVPEFRLKQDAIPGRYTQLWFEAVTPGRYEVLCAELCGVGHSLMRGEVIAMAPEAFDAWMAEQKLGLAKRHDTPPEEPALVGSMIEEGRATAVRLECLRCHTTDGTPHIGPTWLGLYGRTERLTGGGSVVADEAYMTESMMDPLSKLVAGYAPVMPTYQGRLSAPETAAIVEYIKSLKTDVVVTGPSEGPTYEPIPGR